MKLFAFACVAPALILAGCGQAGPEKAEANSSAKDIAQPSETPSLVALPDPAAAIAALRKEKKIIDLVHDPKAQVPWTIGVVDDGSRRVGYAMYVCQVLQEHGQVQEGVSVRIVDYRKFMSNGGDARGASLGHYDCAAEQDLGV